MSLTKVLVFPCGSEIGLEVSNALKYDKHLKLYGLSSVPCHGSLVYKNYIEGIPFISDDSFMEKLNAVIKENEIDVLIPAYDDVILYLARHKDELACRLVTSDTEVCEIARSKKQTYEMLKDEAYIPRTYNLEEIQESDLPLFAKPDIGQGSSGIMKLAELDDLKKLEGKEDDYVICEYLPGKEYTIDCFTDTEGKLIAASMRERIRIRMGISVSSKTVSIPEAVMEIAESLNSRFRFDGVWFFQVKTDDQGNYKLMEFAPRVSGTMSVSRVRGFNYILNSVYQTLGYKVKAIPEPIASACVDRALSNKYRLDIEYNYVYLDFDDTVTLNGGRDVNVMMMAFLYQCLNKGKKIILLTRHAGEIFRSMEKLHIDSGIFHEIIHLKDDRNKSDYVTHKDAVFIDDSFRERYDVSDKCRIPVFDLDSIDALMDWRF
jgi:predicted ATP-grasp superfamily ATP-dependent carboligase